MTVEITDDGEVMVMRCLTKDGLVDTSYCAIGRYSQWPLKTDDRPAIMRDWIRSRKTDDMLENDDLNRASYMDSMGCGS